MRDIRFRVWDARQEKMRHVCELYWSSREICAIEDGPNGEYDIVLDWDEEVELMQAAGLKDKNGRDIYEGDILKCHNTEGYDDRVVSVQFEQGGFAVELPTGESGKNTIGWAIDYYWEVEVIGNIYENPDLAANQKGA